jgi:hypothetical protein
VAEQIAPLSASPLPEIPAGPAAEEVDPRVATVPFPAAAAHAEDGEAAKPSSRRGGAIVLGIGALIAVAVVVVLLVNGGGSKSPAATTTSISTARTTTVGPVTSTPKLQLLTQVNLLAPNPADRRKTGGVAQVVRQGTTTGIVIVAQGLPANTTRNAYAVWLANYAGASRFLGFVSQLVTKNGKLQADGRLPADAASYSRLLVTLETQAKPKSPGAIVLEGSFKLPS